jgi:fluoroacetyl-CoA thioesterase
MLIAGWATYSFCAATPVGMMVKAIVKCTAVEGMKTSWYIEAYDEKDLIGKGTHDRFTINVDKFNQKLEKKIS